MIKIRRKNFMNLPLDNIPIADEYIECNFTRKQPDLSGPQPEGWQFPRPAKFTKCNLTNVKPAPGSTVDEFCNTSLVELDLEIGQQDRIVINGVEQASRTRKVDRAHARRWNPDGSYERHGAPLEFEGK
jgi:hypothetical protein